MKEPYAIYVCLSCGRQGRGPGSHHVAGDDACCSCPVAAMDGRPIQPTLARIEVEVKDFGVRSHLHRAQRTGEQSGSRGTTIAAPDDKVEAGWVAGE